MNKLGYIDNNPINSGGKQQIIFEHHVHYKKLLKQQIADVKAKINIQPKVYKVKKVEDFSLQLKMFKAISQIKPITNSKQNLPIKRNSHINKYDKEQTKQHMTRIINQEHKMNSFKSAYDMKDKNNSSLVQFKKKPAEVKKKMYDYRPISSIQHNR